MAVELSPPFACHPTARQTTTTLPTRMSIACRTRSHANAPLALFAGCCLYHKGNQYHIPTAKFTRAPVEQMGLVGLCKALAMTPNEVKGFENLCKLLKNVDISSALSVLDPANGEFLQHRQLCREPCYKTKWDTSYANDLCQLCQGIGTGPSPGVQLIGNNTFFFINYQDIPSHKCKEICHIIVVCKVCPEKDDPDCTRVTINNNRICYPGDVDSNTASLKIVKLILNSDLSRKDACFSTFDLKNSHLDTPMPNPEYV